MKTYFNKLRYIILVALLINPVIFSMESADNSNLDPEIKEQLELRKNILSLPKDMQMLILQYFWWNLINYKDFKNEQELIDALNEFNCASKLSNTVVKDHLKKSFYRNWQFTFTDLKERIIHLNVCKTPINSELDFARQVFDFRAFKLSKMRLLSIAGEPYKEAINVLFIEKYEEYYDSFSNPKDDDKRVEVVVEFLKMGANPNYKIYFYITGCAHRFERSVMIRAIFGCDIPVIQLFFESKIAVEFNNQESAVTPALREFFRTDKEKWGDFLILLLKNGAAPIIDHSNDVNVWRGFIQRLNVSGEAEVSEYTYNCLSEERSLYTLRKYLAIVFKAKRIRSLLKANLEFQTNPITSLH